MFPHGPHDDNAHAKVPLLAPAPNSSILASCPEFVEVQLSSTPSLPIVEPIAQVVLASRVREVRLTRNLNKPASLLTGSLDASFDLLTSADGSAEARSRQPSETADHLTAEGRWQTLRVALRRSCSRASDQSLVRIPRAWHVLPWALIDE
jgi:hypothetical protein